MNIPLIILGIVLIFIYGFIWGKEDVFSNNRKDDIFLKLIFVLVMVAIYLWAYLISIWGL